SAIKFFDYAQAGVPVLCSRVSPYAEVVDDGRTGALVANTAVAWTAALLAAVDDPAWRAGVAAAAQADVRRRFSLEQTVDAWQALLTALPTRGARRRAGWRDAIDAMLEPLALWLRRFNRDRLARRARRRR
ncbi:MAG: glycosyltransferase, partial [Rubrivivax sp.]|nr:glycosyltransferase [Rubrivivax sp.]